MAFYAFAHAVMQIGTLGPLTKLRDPEFGCKLSLLRQRLAVEPDRPVLVVLGSSRTGEGFRPGVLPAFETPDGRKPFVFNFSQVGSGPLAELLTLRRLLDAGVRPNFLAIEVLPPLLGRTVDAYGNPELGSDRLTWSDLRLLRGFVKEPEELARRWIDAQLAPWHAHRFSIMNLYASNWLPWRLRMNHWKVMDAHGWSDIGVDKEGCANNPRALEVARKTYENDLKNFHITAMEDRALRDLIALCRHERIPTVLYLMPEGSIFRSWYVPATKACIEDYLTRISMEYNLPIVDARRWIEDDDFKDSHHMGRCGATRFTKRFGAEVLPALVRGELDAIRPLLVPIRGTAVPLSKSASRKCAKNAKEDKNEK